MLNSLILCHWIYCWGNHRLMPIGFPVVLIDLSGHARSVILSWKGGMTDAFLIFKQGLGLLDFLLFCICTVMLFNHCSHCNSCTSCITGCCTISDICNYEIIHCRLYKKNKTLVSWFIFVLLILCLWINTVWLDGMIKKILLSCQDMFWKTNHNK